MNDVANKFNKALDGQSTEGYKCLPIHIAERNLLERSGLLRSSKKQPVYGEYE